MRSEISNPFPSCGLYVITRDPVDARHDLAHEVRLALLGGARVVQYRAKEGRASVAEASMLLSLTRECGVPLIINDDVDLALAVGADGIHVGRDDVALTDVRRQLGASAIIGVSCYDDLARAQAAMDQGADYVAFGRFFPSKTKPDAPCASVETLQKARKTLTVPVVAIGGITEENGGLLLDAGADLLAVIEGVFGEEDPESATRRFRALWD